MRSGPESPSSAYDPRREARARDRPDRPRWNRGAACGDDDDEETTATEPAIEIETPEATGPGRDRGPDDSDYPFGRADRDRPEERRGVGRPPKKGKGGMKRGAERADLPECEEIGGGPAPCRRPDGSVSVPERL